MGDNVNHPNHYQNIAGVEAIDILNDVVKDLPGKQAAMLWNTLKYLLRFQKKNGVEDLKKAQNYLQWLINDIEAVQEMDKNIKENTKLEKGPCEIYKSKISGYAEVYYYSTHMYAGICTKIAFTSDLCRDMFIASFFSKLTSKDYKAYSIRYALYDANYIIPPDTTDAFSIEIPWKDIFNRFRMYTEDDKYILEFVYKNVVKE